MRSLDPILLEKALRALAEQIADLPPIHLVACGGSSLMALGLMSRTTTRDVDILAAFEDGQLIPARPLPEKLVEAADRIRAELNLLDDWFNTRPSDESFFRFGFPIGIETRLVTRTYGPSLQISFISRLDQIHFKLYAAADSGPGHHFQDLIELQPTDDELLAAVRWTFCHDDSEGFRSLLSQTLHSLGHERLIDQV